MDPLSITVSCVSLTTAIAKTSISVTKFVRDVRGARSDLDAVSRELLSLKTVLDLLVEDVADGNDAFPEQLRKQITGIVTNCSGVVIDIEEVLNKHEGGKLTKAARWAMVGNEDVNKLRCSLEAHKSALEIALDMVALTLTREIKADTAELLQDTTAIKEQMTADTAQIIAEILRLQQQLPKDTGPNNANGFMLERYLDNLTSYAETVCETYSDGIVTPVARRSEDVQRSTASNRSSLDGKARIEDESATAVNSATDSIVKEKLSSFRPNRGIGEIAPVPGSDQLPTLPARLDTGEDIPRHQQQHLPNKFVQSKSNLQKEENPRPSSNNEYLHRQQQHAANKLSILQSNVNKEQKESFQVEFVDIQFQAPPSNSSGLGRRIEKQLPSKRSSRGRAVEPPNSTQTRPLPREYQEYPSESLSYRDKLPEPPSQSLAQSKQSTRGRGIESNATQSIPPSIEEYEGLPSGLRHGANKEKSSDERITHPPKQDADEDNNIADYLQPGFNPASLSIPRLHSILIAHDIKYPPASKRQLVKIFNDNFLVKRARRPSTDSETDEDNLPQMRYTLANLPQSKLPSVDSTAQQPLIDLEGHTQLLSEDQNPSPSNITVTYQDLPDFIRHRIPSRHWARKFDSEFRTTRSSSLTCEPLQFKSMGFIPRQQQCMPPRSTNIFFSIFVPSSNVSSATSLRATVESLKHELDTLVYRGQTDFNWGRICVGICMDPIPHMAAVSYRNQLGLAFDLRNSTSIYNTAKIRIHEASLHLPFGDPALPMQLIFLERCPTHYTWAQTLSESFKSRLVIRLDSGMRVRHETIINFWLNAEKYSQGVDYKESKSGIISKGVKGLFT